MSFAPNAVEVFSTSPQSSAEPRDQYITRTIDVARWSEQYGCKGILVYTDNSLVDPWLVAQVIVQNTQALCPLVAVQPVRSEEHTSELQSRGHLVCRLLLEKKKNDAKLWIAFCREV